VTDIEPKPVDSEQSPAPAAGPRRYVVQIVIGAILLLAIVVVVLLVATHNVTSASHRTNPSNPSAASPKNMASYGVLLTGKDGQISTVRTPAVTIGQPVPTDTSKHADTVNIVEYIDYQCPICLEFEEANLNNTAARVAEGKATLEIHPVSILDRSSQGTRYSSRAANAADCVANFDPDAFLNATAALYENQPQEGSAGLTNAQVLKVLSLADVTDPAVAKCVDNETYRSWVTDTTTAVENGTFEHVATTPTKFIGTPTVFVNGALYGGSVTDAAAFSAFVTAQTK
jgi:protein-disulfide isomerase